MKTGNITHEELCKTIAFAAKLRGWKVAGFRTVRVQRKDGSIYFETPVREEGKGWPDLIMLQKEKPYRKLAVEIKVKKDTLKPEQREWLELFDKCGFESHVWREKDWIDGLVLEVLA